MVAEGRDLQAQLREKDDKIQEMGKREKGQGERVARLEAGLRDLMNERNPIIQPLKGLKSEKSTQTESRAKAD